LFNLIPKWDYKRKFCKLYAAVLKLRVKLAVMEDICTHAQTGTDRLLLELASCEAKLNAWIRSSAVNAELFSKDPVAAMRAANLGLPEDVLEELASVIASLAKKLSAIA
jgi:hypothetical protein